MQNKLILIIDDSNDNRDLLKMLFEQKGYQVHTACNGLEALGLLNKLTELPQIILLDAEMPIMNGYQFRIEQNKNALIKNIPVIVMTADDHFLVSANMNFPTQVVLKPLRIHSLIESVINLS